MTPEVLMSDGMPHQVSNYRSRMPSSIKWTADPPYQRQLFPLLRHFRKYLRRSLRDFIAFTSPPHLLFPHSHPPYLLMASYVEKPRLNRAAASVHRLLTARKFEHAFFGGYQLGLLGSTRGTRDIDVAVKKPFLNGFDKVKQAFVDDSDFLVFNGNRTDCVNAIHKPSGVHIFVMLEDIPKTLEYMPDDPNHLPFYTPTHMFIRTIHSLAKHSKESHRQDLVYLYRKMRLDSAKVYRKVTPMQRDAALANCGNNEKAAAILNGLNLPSRL